MNKSTSVILDPVKSPPNGMSRHDQRLEEILDSGPVAEKINRNTFKQKAVKFCGSRIGIALISIVIFFFLLLILQPTYIFKKNKDNEFSLKHINYTLVFIISVVGGICVFFIPYFINKQ